MEVEQRTRRLRAGARRLIRQYWRPAVHSIVGTLIMASGAFAGSAAWDRFTTARDAEVLLFLEGEVGDKRLAKGILRYSRDFDLDALAVTAIVWKESSYRQMAHEKRKGNDDPDGGFDRGYMGISWKRAIDVCEKFLRWPKEAARIRRDPKRLYDSELNLTIGCANLRWLLDTHASCHDHFDAYCWHNAGPSAENGSYRNVAAMKDKYFRLSEKWDAFSWRNAR